MVDPHQEPGEDERLGVLEQLESWLEGPMQVLGFVWLALLVLEVTRGISPALALATTVIWVLFILDFALRLVIAPAKREYLARNWLTVLSLIVPALRILRPLRAVRLFRASGAVRGARLVRVVGSVNRGMNALRRSMGRRGLGYVVALTTIVILAGAAGMLAFERAAPGGGFRDYGTALWWTAMIMTTLGTEYWPRTTEGRLLCLLLALYAVAVFGYVTASLATFFVGREAESGDSEIASAAAIERLRNEVAALAAEVRAAGSER